MHGLWLLKIQSLKCLVIFNDFEEFLFLIISLMLEISFKYIWLQSPEICSFVYKDEWYIEYINLDTRDKV
jgi:hypothetical protein